MLHQRQRQRRVLRLGVGRAARRADRRGGERVEEDGGATSRPSAHADRLRAGRRHRPRAPRAPARCHLHLALPAVRADRHGHRRGDGAGRAAHPRRAGAGRVALQPVVLDAARRRRDDHRRAAAGTSAPPHHRTRTTAPPHHRRATAPLTRAPGASPTRVRPSSPWRWARVRSARTRTNPSRARTHTNGARANAQAHGGALDATSHQPIWDSDERRAVMREAGGWEQPYQRLAFPESLPQVRPEHLLACPQPRPTRPDPPAPTHPAHPPPPPCR